MGTNFYIKTKKCNECGHKPEGLHLGKSSAGWQFSFQYNGGKYYKSVEAMKEWLKGKEIENEYGETVTYDQFWKMVDDKQSEKLNHAVYCREHYPERREKEIDFLIEGYSFSNCEFS